VPLLAADCKTFPSLRTTSLEHEPPVFGAHANQKSVGSPAVPRVWLERPLSLHDIPSAPRAREIETVNGSERVLKVSIGVVCATVGVLQLVSESPTPAVRMRIWSVPKDFHTCGKNCGKSPEFLHLLGFCSLLAEIFEWRRFEIRIKTRRPAARNGCWPKIGGLLKAKPGRKRFLASK